MPCGQRRARPSDRILHARALDGLLYCKRCPTCRAKHNLSYAKESTRLAQGKQVPYDGAMDRTRKYVQLSRDIIFEGEMLWRLDTQMLHAHTGFEPYAKEWTTFADEPPQLVVPLRYALSHAWLAWTPNHLLVAPPPYTVLRFATSSFLFAIASFAASAKAFHLIRRRPRAQRAPCLQTALADSFTLPSSSQAPQAIKRSAD